MTERKRAAGSDLKRDAHVLKKKDYDEIPELTEEWFERARWHKGGVPLPHVPRGRPKLSDPKQAISLRLDPDIIAHFRKTGRGWQGRMNAALRKAAKLSTDNRKKA